MTEASECELHVTPERVLDDNANLTEMESYFDRLYVHRDAIYLPGREIREQLLYRGISDLQDAVRKDAGAAVYETMCARVASRIFCVARGVDYVSVAAGLMMKYPMESCGYCGKMPCECPEKRPQFEPVTPDSGQSDWTLRDWQEHLTKMYGQKNLDRGIDYVLLRLGSEYGELITLERSISRLTIEEVKSEYSMELGDAMAWTIASASVLGVDLQKATQARYASGCSICKQIPCVCPPHSFEQVRQF